MGAILRELATQVLEVVDLAVEDDDVAGLGVGHRLLAPLAQVDDGEPAESEDDSGSAVGRGGHPETARVRPAVTLRGAHAAHGVDDCLVDLADGSRDAAHGELGPLAPRH